MNLIIQRMTLKRVLPLFPNMSDRAETFTCAGGRVEKCGRIPVGRWGGDRSDFASHREPYNALYRCCDCRGGSNRYNVVRLKRQSLKVVPTRRPVLRLTGLRDVEIAG